MEVTHAHPVTCTKCGRALRSAASVARRIGPWCLAKVRAAARVKAVAGFTAEQWAKALELIEDGGIIRTGHAGVYRAVSGDGQRTYLVHAATDNCPAGLRSRKTCYHSLSARLLGA